MSFFFIDGCLKFIVLMSVCHGFRVFFGKPCDMIKMCHVEILGFGVGVF